MNMKAAELDISIQDYKTTLLKLDDFGKQCLKVLDVKKGHKIEADQKSYSIYLFHKILSQCYSLYCLLPYNSMHDKKNTFWDISSPALITRGSLETFGIMVYLSNNVPDVEFMDRMALFLYHETCARLNLMKKFDPKSELLPEMERSKEKHKTDLINSGRFNNSSKEYKKILLDGNQTTYGNIDQIVHEYGFNEKYYQYANKLLSNLGHPTSLSVHKGIGMYDDSPDNVFLFKRVVAFANEILLIGCDLFLINNPDARSAVSIDLNHEINENKIKLALPPDDHSMIHRY